MRPARPSLQSAYSRTVSALLLSMTWIADAATAMWRLIRQSLRYLTHHVRSLWTRGKRGTSNVLSGPAKRFVTGPLRTFLVGRRTDVAILAVLLAPVLALAATWWVSSTVGYETLVAWVRGTWFGTNPSLAVFAAAAALVVLGAISAAVNSGILPTSLLVSAPIFGAAVTRYGTTVTHTWGSQVVSLPNAVGMAIVFGLSFGIPLGVAGFLLGSLLRRIATVFRGQSGPASPAESA